MKGRRKDEIAQEEQGERGESQVAAAFLVLSRCLLSYCIVWIEHFIRTHQKFFVYSIFLRVIFSSVFLALSYSPVAWLSRFVCVCICICLIMFLLPALLHAWLILSTLV